MSAPVSIHPLQIESSTLGNAPGIKQDLVLHTLDFGTLWNAQRKQISNMASIYQALFQNMQRFAFSQTDLMRRSVTDTTNLMRSIMSLPITSKATAPDEKPPQAMTES